MASERFLVDPSLLLRRESLESLPAVIDALDEAYVAYVPGSFRDLLEGDGRGKTLGDHFEALEARHRGDGDAGAADWNVYTVYSVLDPERAADPEAVRSTLRRLGVESTGVDDPEEAALPGDVSGPDVYADLPYAAGDVRRDILFEEAVFLLRDSPVVSRLRKPFRQLIDAGFGAFEAGGAGAERLPDRRASADRTQTTLDEFGLAAAERPPGAESEADPDPLRAGRDVLAAVEAAYERPRHGIYVAFGNVTAAFDRLFGSEPLSRTAEDVRERVLSRFDEELADALGATADAEAELDAVRRDLERLAVPPEVARGVALLGLAYEPDRPGFVLVDPG